MRKKTKYIPVILNLTAVSVKKQFNIGRKNRALLRNENTVRFYSSIEV